MYFDTPQDGDRRAALTNLPFNSEFFASHVLGHSYKAETHRLGHETSEDALTWNVFTRLASSNRLKDVLCWVTGDDWREEPELYLWGLRIDVLGQAPVRPFEALGAARERFESGIARFLTEPDIMLRVPGKLLVLIEAKFTSGNPIAADGVESGPSDEKPKSRAGIRKRYHCAELNLRDLPRELPLYSQLYRNLVFAGVMAGGLEWRVVNLVSATQWSSHTQEPEYQDPTPAMASLLPEDDQHRFRHLTWEGLYRALVADHPDLADLDEYMRFKTANCRTAFAL